MMLPVRSHICTDVYSMRIFGVRPFMVPKNSSELTTLAIKLFFVV